MDNNNLHVMSSTRPLIMGILNVTPDSFSDGGEYYLSDNAIERAFEMVGQGADIIDIGGESTRPGSKRVSPQEQIQRIVPVVKGLVDKGISVPISIDSTSSEVIEAAFDSGAGIINDISAFEEDPKLLELAAKLKCPVIIMHKKGTIASMQDNPEYGDVVADVYNYLKGRVDLALKAGVAIENITVDPGIGFGKTVEHNLKLIANIDKFHDIGISVLLGASRKSFIGKLLNIEQPKDRIFGDAAVLAYSIAAGVDIVRVHDISSTSQVVKMMRALMHNKDNN